MTLGEKFKKESLSAWINDTDTKKLEKVANSFAIGFAEWLKESGYIIELIKGSRKTNNILEIYKKEKGL